MFEITADDIASLNDTDLRSLVALLCEAELRQRRLPAAAVTWGGSQTAADGGLDVRVDLPIGTAIDGFVPRANCGFQVKKPDMPRREIIREMRPDGEVRPAIKELADRNGAYIIVSSMGSTSDTSLRGRRAAMSEAIDDLQTASSLLVDFYDRSRLATWVRGHAGIIAWVRAKIGRPIPGWRSYGSWAYAPEGMSAEYLIDDEVRVQTGRKEDGDGLRTLQAINHMRDTLRNAGKVVRLVGLSGLGKTRLVQALFDERVGDGALDPARAIYTDMADGPDPQPAGLLSYLLAARFRAVLVIDNCPPDLHRRLADLCRSQESTVSVITVEYDIREDQPEGTEVFALKPNSIELTEKLVRHRYTNVSATDARTIAEYSGGNARIAIALAATIGHSESIAGLTDDDLFRRLFQQRHSHDESLLLTAQACALVYSFDGEDVSDASELSQLGGLIGRSAQEMFRSVSELRRRDLCQRRGIWRAVLPHAIANRIAKSALQSIPTASLSTYLIADGSTRLSRSFSRRIGYLHDSPEAIALVRCWLADGGLLGDPANLDQARAALFENVAPVVPEATLATLERSFPQARPEALVTAGRYVGLVRSLAYDAKLFERAATFLSRLAETDNKGEASRRTKDAFVSLFYIYFSGTHATIEQRLELIRRHLTSTEARKQAIGLDALRASLQASHFSSGHGFEFGARPRDYGFTPHNGNDVRHWFASALTVSSEFGRPGTAFSSRVRAAVAEEFRALWGVGIHDELETVCRQFAGLQFWPEGWLAIRQTLHYDGKGMTSGVRARLQTLAQILAPSDLLQKVRSIVLPHALHGLSFDDDVAEDDDTDRSLKLRDRASAMSQELGKEVATDEPVFDQLLAEMMSGQSDRLWPFGEGLAEGAQNPQSTWTRMVSQLAATPTQQQSVHVLRGFLHGLDKADPSLAQKFLEDAVDDANLAPWYPVLETAVRIDTAGANRLIRSITIGTTPIDMYRNLGFGRATESIAGQKLKEILLALSQQPGGIRVAVNVLSMQLFVDNSQKRSSAPEIIDAGREILRHVEFVKESSRDDHLLGSVVKACLQGGGGSKIARRLTGRLKRALSKYKTYAFDNDYLLKALIKVQPAAVLDGFFRGSLAEGMKSVDVFKNRSHRDTNVFDGIYEETLLRWCDRNPGVRYRIASAFVTLAAPAIDGGGPQLSSIASCLLDKSPDRLAVLNEYVKRFRPRSWSGSRADIIEANAKLLVRLETYPDSAVVNFVAAEKIRLVHEIELERQRDTARDRETDERFE